MARNLLRHRPPIPPDGRHWRRRGEEHHHVVDDTARFPRHPGSAQDRVSERTSSTCSRLHMIGANSSSYLCQVMSQAGRIAIMDPRDSAQVIIAKEKNAFAPNFIHSLDATHLYQTALECEVSYAFLFVALDVADAASWTTGSRHHHGIGSRLVLDPRLRRRDPPPSHPVHLRRPLLDRCAGQPSRRGAYSAFLTPSRQKTLAYQAGDPVSPSPPPPI